MKMHKIALVIFLSLVLYAPSAFAYETKAGPIEEIMSCWHSDRGIGLIKVDGMWFMISDTSEPESQDNFTLALAAFLSGKSVWIKGRSGSSNYCQVTTSAYLSGSDSYARMKLSID